MLTAIIGPGDSPSPSPPPPPIVELAPVFSTSDNIAGNRKKVAKSDDDSSPERLKTEVMESIKRNKIESKLREASDMRRDVEPYT